MTLPLPKEVFEQHLIALGKTGAGKSSALRDMVEWLLDHKERVVIITPKADWWGLKVSADGKEQGYEIVVFGGDHADMPLHHLSGKAMAELLATGNRSAVLQMRDFMPGERTQFWIDFASNLFRLLKGKLYLVIDEVHNFAPKGKILDPKAGLMLHWSNKLASEARGLGITLLAASQRPQKVHNDFLTSCETLIAMRVTTKWDRDAVKDWIEGCGDPIQGKEVLNTLAGMKRGDAWAWSPEIEFGPKQVHFPMFKTFDSFAPRKDQGTVKLKGWAETDLSDIREKLNQYVKEVEANDPKLLKAKVAQLERELQTALIRAPQKSNTVVHKTSEAEIRRILQDEIEPWREYAQTIRRELVAARKLLEDFSRAASSVTNASGTFLAQSVPDYPKFTAQKYDAKPIQQELLAENTHKTSTKYSQIIPTKNLIPPGPRPGLAENWRKTRDPNGLPVGERTVLTAVAQHGGLDRAHLTILTGYKKSSRNAYIQRLQQKGYVEDNGDLVTPTQEGMTALGQYEQIPRGGQALREFYQQKLPVGEWTVLKVLLDAQGAPVGREAIGEATGYQKSSRNAYLQRLAARQLVTTAGRDMVQAAEVLFRN